MPAKDFSDFYNDPPKSKNLDYDSYDEKKILRSFTSQPFLKTEPIQVVLEV